MISFRHAGDLGDVIYGLPAIKHICTSRNDRGLLLIEASHYTRQRLTPDKWFGLDNLIRAQSYIADVQPFMGQSVQFNLNDFRARMQPKVQRGQDLEKSLVDWQLEAMRCPLEVQQEPWLTVTPTRIRKVVINRTGVGRDKRHVYVNPMFPWRKVLDKYSRDAVFIGTEEEHAVFSDIAGPVDYCVTPTLFEAASVIAGAELFIGNQSVCHAIAEGLKQNIILEVWPHGPNCLFHRPGVFHGWDRNVILPNISTSPTATTTELSKLPMPESETDKHRHLVQQFCSGNGVDLGSSGYPIVPWAIQVDLPLAEYKHYNNTRPEAAIHWRGSALDLPFKDGVLDWVHASHLIEDFKDWVPVLAEWSRVIKPGGHLIIAVPSHERFRAAVARGQGDNLSHKHESRIGELPEHLPSFTTVMDRFANDHPHEYSIVYVGRKP